MVTVGYANTHISYQWKVPQPTAAAYIYSSARHRQASQLWRESTLCDKAHVRELLDRFDFYKLDFT